MEAIGTIAVLCMIDTGMQSMGIIAYRINHRTQIFYLALYIHEFDFKWKNTAYKPNEQK